MKEFINIAKSERTMKKSKLTIALVVLSAMGFACTPSANKDLDGAFSGTDGSNQLPNQIDWTISVAGDDLLSGIWNSKGEITQGQLSGKLGHLRNELTLYVQSGSCLGQFRGDFTFEKDELKGTLKGNTNCPERAYHFNLKKVH
jgi:hypothetical protein